MSMLSMNIEICGWSFLTTIAMYFLVTKEAEKLLTGRGGKPLLVLLIISSLANSKDKS